MTVKELIVKLQQYKGYDVQFSSDEEGNVLSREADVVLVDEWQDATGKKSKKVVVVFPLSAMITDL